MYYRGTLPTGQFTLCGVFLPGYPYDNAKAKSFMKTLKQEEAYLFECRNIQEARRRIDYFIGEVCNEDRLMPEAEA